MRKTAISLFIDDTGMRPVGGVAALLDFCAVEGVRGKLSLIPGRGVKPGQRHMGEMKAPEAVGFTAEIAGAAERGFDVQMELMTHRNLWDFASGAVRPDGPHEGVWLMDPDVAAAEYEACFAGVLDAEKAGGVAINGVSVPGCGSDACTAR